MNTKELNDKYLEFASKVSFFEFGKQKEYRPALIDADAFSEAIAELQSKNNWNIDNLSDYITKLPESFKLFENLFRLDRFSNAQLIHFLFDTNKLNSSDLNAIYEYAIFNLKFDKEVRRVFLELASKELGRAITYEYIVSGREEITKEAIVAYFKMVVNIYAIRADTNLEYVENRIKEKQFNDSTIRIANYVLDTLQLNNFLRAVKVKDYLNTKLIPIDTKSIHGNFLKNRLMEMLDKAGIKNIDAELKKHGINKLPEDLSKLNLKTEKCYCTEKYIEKVNKLGDGRGKKFDIVIIVKNKPKHLFEANFYTTEGTKIGINENEYVALNDAINKIGTYNFHWITDGNYWLTRQGKERYLNLLGRFTEIYNANMFATNLDNFTR